MQPMQPITTPYVNASLYVGDLHPEVHEGMLLEYFGRVGAVASVRVCRDSATRQSLGYGYVNYHSYADAERALMTLNYTNIKERPIRIMWCQRDPTPRRNSQNNIFVKNIGTEISPRILSDTFTKFGNVVSCKVPFDQKGRQKGYGFVHFEKETAAQEAIKEAKLIIQNSEIQVAPYLPRDQRPVMNKNDQFSNVYMKHFDPSMTKEDLQKELEEKFGKITSLVIPMKPDGQTPKGFAFCNFENSQIAQAAVEKAKDVTLGPKPLYASPFQSRTERDRELRERIHSNPASVPRPNTNIYVKNLDSSVDDAVLTQSFSSFGTITSAKVQKDGPISRGFGFVNFKTPDEAQKAVAEMNGRFLAQKSLYVAPFQPKSIRQAQLSAQWAQRYYQMQQQPQFPMFPPMMYPGAPRAPFYGMMQTRPQQWQRMPTIPAYMPQTQQYIPQTQQYMPTAVMGIPPQQQNQMRGPRMNSQTQQQKRPNTQQAPPMKANYTSQRPIKYAQNAQNVRPTNFSGLTATQLAAASPTEQKNMLGERLYALIAPSQGERAGKITGMLLEMDNSELLILLENHQDLQHKVQEAIAVLEAHQQSS